MGVYTRKREQKQEMKSDFLLSVVVPVYKEENNIVPFLERTVKVMEEKIGRAHV